MSGDKYTADETVELENIEISNRDRDTSVEDQVHHPKNWWNIRVVLNCIVLGFALCLYGYDNAFASPLVSLPLFVLKYQGPGVGGALVLTADNLDLVITVPLVGAAIGAFAAPPLQKYLGRKWSLIFSYAFCSAPASFLQLFAPSLAAMVIGRFWNYVGVSILTNIAPLYLTELMPAHLRARSVGFASAAVGLVSVLATVAVYLSSALPDARSFMIPLGIQAGFPLTLLILTLFMTESPIWLLSKGRMAEARLQLLRLRNSNERVVDAELAVQSIALKQSEELKLSTKWTVILRKENIERTLVSGFLICTSQVGGQSLTGTYATVVLVTAGVTDPFKLTVIIFLCTWVGLLSGPVLIDKVGRRPVALVGFTLLFVIDLLAGGLAFTGLTSGPQAAGFAALCMIFSFINAASFSILAVLLPAEVPSASLRELTITWSVFWSYVTAVITSFAVPQMISAGAGNLGPKAFLVFGGCMAFVLVVTFLYLPETKARTLAEIDELYATGLPKRQWRDYTCIRTMAAEGERVAVIEQDAASGRESVG